MRVFTSYEEAARFAPEAIAGTRSQLLELDPAPFSLSRAVIALGRPGDRLLTAAERDRLWRSFNVPVFEQIIGLRGQLLAAECEAHDGLHIQETRAETHWSSGDAYNVVQSTCSCGSNLPRVFSQKSADQERAATAYATNRS